jgi:hypothetical protein
VTVVLVFVLVIGGVAGFVWWKDNTTVCQGKLTVTIHNMNYYSDIQYDLYFDGESVDNDTIPAHHDLTITWNVGWVAADPYKDVSIVWAGGSETRTVFLKEGSVSSVSFTVT